MLEHKTPSSNGHIERGQLEQQQIDRFDLESLRAKRALTFDINLLRGRLSYGSRAAIAIDLGGSKATSATIIVGRDFNTAIDISTLQTRNGEGYLKFLEQIYQKSLRTFTPVGISTAGVVEEQRLANASHLSHFLNDLGEHNGDFSRVFPTLLKTVANDAVAGSVGSYIEALRQFPNTKQIIYLINGSGLGAAVIKDGIIWSMEPGHVEAVSELNPYDQKEICTLTNVPTSCIHTLTSGIGMENLYFKLKQTGEKIDGEELARRSSHGDELATDIYQNSARLTAATIRGIESAFGIAANHSDTTIVCHGGTFNAGAYRDAVVKLLDDNPSFKPQIIFTKDFSQNACLVGAALAAIMS